MRKIVIALLATLFVVLGVVPASASSFTTHSQGAGVYKPLPIDRGTPRPRVTTPTAHPHAFSLSCHLTSAYDGRIDTPGITRDGLGTADTTDFWARSIDRDDNTLSSLKFEYVLVQLRNHSDGTWKNWTSIGGTATDNVLVGPSKHWDPSGKTNVSSYWDKMRYYFVDSGQHSCYSPVLTF